MRARVGPEVDRVERGLDERRHRGDERLAVAEEREDGAVVVGVRRPVEKDDAGTRLHGGLGERRDDVVAAPLADVRDAFDEPCHVASREDAIVPDASARRFLLAFLQ